MKTRVAMGLAAAMGICFTVAAAAQMPFLPNPVRTVSTVPANGDVNPYGVAFVPSRFPAGGAIHAGDILVSNFNDANNQQGTGTTIVDVPPSGAPSLFFQAAAGSGLSTALAVLDEGLVIVGNFPTTDGTCATAAAGSLLVIDANGKQLDSISGANIDGPWDMTVFERPNHTALIFVANVLSGSVERLDAKVSGSGITVTSSTEIASGYTFRCDPAALVVGPTGLVYNPETDILYVASTADNAIYEVLRAGATNHNAGKGHVIYQDKVHLHGPIAMAEAPNGHLLVSNADVINSDPNQPSEIVEFTTEGKFVKQLAIDPSQGGSFGLAVAVSGHTAQFAAVDDVTNTLTIWTLPAE